ncbi:hypothetical protein T439DRAFT_383001 [Meredithblackwellia eburnea MCA 4105]
MLGWARRRAVASFSGFACQCTSTSTNIAPCRHSVHHVIRTPLTSIPNLHIRSFSQARDSSEVSPIQDGKEEEVTKGNEAARAQRALEYAAPLWTDSEWFTSSRRKEKGMAAWIESSRTSGGKPAPRVSDDDHTPTPPSPPPSPDLAATLTFVHHLVSPKPDLTGSGDPDDRLGPPRYLTLAVTHLQQLIDQNNHGVSFAEPPPAITASGVELPATVRVRVAVLRTVVSYALECGLFNIAYDSLMSLDYIRKLYPTDRDDDADILLLEEFLYSISGSLRQSRFFSYQPRATGTAHPLMLASNLAIKVLPEWLAHHPQLWGSKAVSAILTRLVDEAASRRRWDIVANIVDTWAVRNDTRLRRLAPRSATTKQGWVLTNHHRHLLRWYFGESPYSTYGGWSFPQPTSTSSSSTPRLNKSPRPVNAGRAYSLALTMLRHYKVNKGIWATSWTMEDKSELIELLTTSRGSNLATRKLAQDFYRMFSRTVAAPAEQPFMLSQRALLHLVRISCPPYNTKILFAQNVVLSHIRLLNSPSSPYASSMFNHSTLTVLAQCYLMMNDLDSVVQVYRWMLDHKITPALVDIKCILQCATRRHPTYGHQYLTFLHANGAIVSVPLFKYVMLESRLYFNSNQKSSLEAAWVVLKRLIKLARAFDFKPHEMMSLKKFASDLASKNPKRALSYVLGSPHQDLAPNKIRRALIEGVYSGNWRWVSLLWDLAFHRGYFQEDMLELVLRFIGLEMLEYKRERLIPENKDDAKKWVLNAIKAILRRSSDQPRLIYNPSTFRLILRLYMIHGDWKTMIWALRRLKALDVHVDDKIRTQVQEWGKEQGGVEFEEAYQLIEQPLPP